MTIERVLATIALFVDGQISAAEFERRYLDEFSRTPQGWSAGIDCVLNELFYVVEDFASDPELRDVPEDLTDDQLADAPRAAHATATKLLAQPAIFDDLLTEARDKLELNGLAPLHALRASLHQRRPDLAEEVTRHVANAVCLALTLKAEAKLVWADAAGRSHDVAPGTPFEFEPPDPTDARHLALAPGPPPNPWHAAATRP